MNKLIKLSSAVTYNNTRIKSDKISLENFVTTDNLLQNKAGITLATNLPPQGSTMSAFKTNNILVANIRPYLKKIWFANRNGGCSADVLVFDVKKGFYPKYVYYSIYRDDFFSHMMRGSKGTKMPRGDKNQILDFLLPNYAIYTQQKIASVLSSLDSKIELNNRINVELEAMAKTLYDYWFVQFDFPDAYGKPYKTSGGKMVWSMELKREIPEGWIVKSLGEIADIKAGGDKPKIYSETQTDAHQIPIFSNGITNEGLYGFTSEAKILKPSITVSARGTIGYCVLRNKPFVPIIRLIVVTPNNSYESKFLYERIKSMGFDNSGSVQLQLTVPQISDLKVVMPNSEILKKYDTFTSSGIKKIELNKEENQQLSSLRDWLLPMLMNGQVKVTDVEEKLNIAAESDIQYNKS